VAGPSDTRITFGRFWALWKLVERAEIGSPHLEVGVVIQTRYSAVQQAGKVRLQVMCLFQVTGFLCQPRTVLIEADEEATGRKTEDI